MTPKTFKCPHKYWKFAWNRANFAGYYKLEDAQKKTNSKFPCVWCHGSGKTTQYELYERDEVTCLNCGGRKVFTKEEVIAQMEAHNQKVEEDELRISSHAEVYKVIQDKLLEVEWEFLLRYGAKMS